MEKEKIVYIFDIKSLSKLDILTIDACLEVLRDYRDNEYSLLDAIKDLIIYEGSGYEMFGILVGRENESDYDEFFEKTFIEKMKTDEIIIFYYNDDYIAMPEKLGVKIIIDWCSENATHPDIPVLCDKLKKKYGL